MATPTYTLIDSTVLSSAASSVTFSSIPADYRDLVLVVEASTTASGYSTLRANSDSGSNYTYVHMNGNGSGTSSATGTASTLNLYPYFYAGNKNLVITQIMDYSATDKHKTALARGNDPTTTGAYAIASRWANTAAITSLTLAIADWAAGSTFYLYGIEA